MSDDNPQAFPSGNGTQRLDLGMTLRDYFAAAAIAQCLVPATTYAELTYFFGKDVSNITNAQIAAARAYEVADAMLARRKRP